MSSINPAALPAPDVIETLDFETLLQARKDRLLELYPAVADVIDNEAEPLNILLQANAYREMVYRQRINDSILAMTLAYAEDADLDYIGNDRFKLPRLIVIEADDTTTPPTEAVYETDDEYRARLHRSLDTQSVAGPSGAYESLAISAHGNIGDAKATSPSDGVVEIAVVSRAADGQTLLSERTAVRDACRDDSKRPITDNVVVVQSPVTLIDITATLHVGAGASPEIVRTAAEAAAAPLISERSIGSVLALSRLHALLHVANVLRVDLGDLTNDIDPGTTGTVVVNSITITTTAD